MGEGDRMTAKSALSGGRKTDDQRRLVAMTAVEVVSRLALETKREDVSGTGNEQYLAENDIRSYASVSPYSCSASEVSTSLPKPPLSPI